MARRLPKLSIQKLSFKSLITIVFLLLIGIVALLKFIPSRSISAAWWNEGWMYRKAINIGNTGAAQTDTQVKLLDNYDLSASVTAGKIQSDLDDLRFTDVNGKLISYWIEDATNNSVDVWGIIPSLPTSGAGIFMYYGNPSASAASTTTNMTIGGTMTSVAGYRIHTFKGNGTLTNGKASNAEVLVVGGGGGGGTSQTSSGGGGGGGAGGLTYNASYALTQGQIVNVTVGISGAPGGTNLNQSGNNGTGSTFGTITVSGGGGGANVAANGKSGGSGGGGGYNLYTTVKYGGSAVVGTGYSGGATTDLTSAAGAGGGGAGGVGGNNKASHVGGDGGAGLSYSITGVSVTYAAGGRGGGGAGAADSPANTGKGGDAAYAANVAKAGANGIVVVRYLSGSAATPATEEISEAPLAYWKFDEGIGTTLYDSSSNQNNGVFGTGNSAPTWQTEDQCISGKCLYFNGNNYINLNSSTNANVTGDITVSVWIKPKSPETQGVIIHKDTQYSLLMKANKTVAWADSSDWSYANFGDHNIGIESGKWNHISVTKIGGIVKIYLNGKQKVSKSFGSSLTSAATITYFGCYSTSGACNGNYFSGFIDEPKIYPYARSAAQIKSDYSAGKSGNSSSGGSSASLGGSNKSGEFLSDGLVGYWKMEEGVGTTTLDSSGNSNTGTLGTGNSAPGWSNGKYGIGLSFDGTDVVDTGYKIQAGARSYFLWIKYNSLTGVNGYSLTGTQEPGAYTYLGIQDGGQGYFYAGNNGGTFNYAFSTGQWYHVGLTMDGTSTTKIYVNGAVVDTKTYTSDATATLNFLIGRVASSNSHNINGLIDEIRLYNRTLSPTEVSQLYNWAPGPIGYWDFNENIGTTAYDKSGNNRNGGWLGTLGSQWTAGKYGSAGKFNGSNNYVKILDNSIFDFGSNNFTVSYWVNKKQTSSGWSNTFGVNKWNTGAAPGTNEWSLGLTTAGSDDKPIFGIESGSNSYNISSPNNININQWYYLTGVRNGNSLLIYVNGVQVGSTTVGNVAINNVGRDINIAFGASTSYTNAIFDEVKIYNYARTNKQIVEDMNASHPAGGSPVGSQLAYWKFDEGYGSTINNIGNGGIGLSGVFGTGNSAPTWSNNGKFGKALSFDGSNDYLQINDHDNIDIGTEDFSITGWIKTSTTGFQIIASKGASCSGDASNCFRLHTNSNGTFGAYIEAGDGDTWVSTDDNQANIQVDDNVWHHVAATYDRDGNLTIYVDSIQDGTVNISGESATLTNIYPLQIGKRASSTHFQGLMDEVKIYNYALTADEVKIDYNRNAALQFGSLSSGTGNTAPATAASQEYCIPGDTTDCSSPIAHFSLDENNGTSIYDKTGNSYVSTTTRGSPRWTPGKFGSALSFNGTSDSVGFNGPTTSANETMTAWVYIDSSSSSGDIVGNAHTNWNTEYGFTFYLDGNTLRTKASTNGDTYFYSNVTYDVTSLKNRWIHLGMSWDNLGTGTGGCDATVKLYVNGNLVDEATHNVSSGGYTCTAPYAYPFSMGGTTINSLTRPTKVKLDEVKVYNYVRTPAQIAWDYNKGGPIGWWKFNECQSNIAYDSSGVGNTGTITIGASGTQNTLGTCSVGTSAAWTNGASGKLNSSLNFDGTDDYVWLGSPTIFSPNKLTFSAWFKTPSNISGTIIRNRTYGYGLTLSSGDVVTHVYESSGSNLSIGTSPTKYGDNNWHLATTTYDGTTIKLYVDGKFITSQTGAGTGVIYYSGNAVGIGRDADNPGNYFTGQIDDVRIYNYALTATQIKTLYSNGAVNFGPASGSP